MPDVGVGVGSLAVPMSSLSPALPGMMCAMDGYSAPVTPRVSNSGGGGGGGMPSAAVGNSMAFQAGIANPSG